jgi:signal transduction histidine kinase
MSKVEKPINVLLIEDNPGDADLIEEILSGSAGTQFNVVMADRLVKGLDRLAAEPIDVVILDLSLPDSKGLDTFLRLHKHKPALPVVVLSGLNDEALALKAMQAGAQDYLVKGEIDGTWLARSLRYAIERKRLEEAEQALHRLKEDFFATVSHQLRTPLTSLSGFLKLLLDGKVKEPAVQQEFLKRSFQDTNRLMTLVNDLLDVFHLEASGFKMDLQAEVELNALIAETLHSLQGVAAQKRISLAFTALPAPIIVKADRHWLQQVLVNLIGNAIKFSEAQRPVQISAAMTDNQVTIKIVDQGPGIAPEALPKLFNKFSQVSSPAQGNTPGTGLGLYISKAIIEAHRGQIGVESDGVPGRGSAFYFSLPFPVPSRLRRLKTVPLPIKGD